MEVSTISKTNLLFPASSTHKNELPGLRHCGAEQQRHRLDTDVLATHAIFQSTSSSEDPRENVDFLSVNPQRAIAKEEKSIYQTFLIHSSANCGACTRELD